MATVHDATLSPGKVELVAGWIGAQRWYTGTGRPRLRALDSWRLDDPAGEVGIETLVLLDEVDSVVYQVPLTYRGAPLEGGGAALVGEMDHSVLGRRWVYDAPHDPVYVEQLLALARGRAAAQHGSVSDTPEPDVRGVPHPTWPNDPVVRSSRVHGGEQSNTSVVVDATPSPVVVKIFRTLAAGDNPDITLQEALAQAQSPFVPASIGHVEGAWTRPDGEQRDHGQIAFVQEYLADSTDAWQVGLEQAAGGTPLRGAHAVRGTHSVAPQDIAFADRARELGRVTAQVHSTLARVLPTRTADAAAVSEHVGRMRRRAGIALGEVPALAAHEGQINRLLRAAEKADWPVLQRIHGDLHLGQVLDSPRRGWVLIDFEGEPLRPLAERNALDSPLRDVAGLLRSLDYVAGTLTRPGARTAPGVDVRQWCTRAQEAFLDGYGEIDTDPRERETLLTAFVLDKALYEVIYEARNRPSWLPLPLEAIDRLLKEAHP
ncbi:maltokinase N-terminal cap-like domain-containing protein [Janibacter cremeus]|uniref:Maltokinase n=1 Tax=Janibacter cremeus TaxID=1285192 RepID=A0A852VNP5_9MICO|nr:aminoglycoside phosphotransferase [Janibacter cremeus]NYF97308.1 trehalose synthase-fused probable maltokinase [Janibacter cremeus]